MASVQFPFPGHGRRDLPSDRKCPVVVVRRQVHVQANFNLERVEEMLNQILQKKEESAKILCKLEGHFAVIEAQIEAVESKLNWYSLAIPLLTASENTYVIRTLKHPVMAVKKFYDEVSTKLGAGHNTDSTSQ